MRQTIDGAMFRRMVISAAASIEIHKEKINELNVFPVPDGDTGTNMSMTLNAAAADLRKADEPTLGKAASITAKALLRGARGDCGAAGLEQLPLPQRRQAAQGDKRLFDVLYSSEEAMQLDASSPSRHRP